MNLSQYSTIRNRIVTIVLLLLAMFVMATPALANSSSYSWLAYSDYGYVIDGSVNGVFHTMTAGTLTNSGSLWVTRTNPNPINPPTPFYISVKKSVVGPDPTICTTGAVTPSVMVGSQYAVSYSKGCGTISAGTYYLYIWRNAIDGREVKGSGTLRTP